jgi:F-type H+-transporting ATPase subunit b
MLARNSSWLVLVFGLLAAPMAVAAQAPTDHAAPTAVEATAHEGAHEAAAHDGHGAGAHAGEHHFDVKSFIATVVNFLIWLAIVIVLLRKPLMEYLRTRRLSVIEGLEQSKRLREAAEQKHAEYTERLANLDKELAKLRQEMIQAGESERDRIIAEAEARAARMRRDAQFVIDQQMKQLKADLTREAIEAAIAAAEQMLRDQTATPDQQRLAEAYLGNLESSIKDKEVRA